MLGGRIRIADGGDHRLSPHPQPVSKARQRTGIRGRYRRRIAEGGLTVKVALRADDNKKMPQQKAATVKPVAAFFMRRPYAYFASYRRHACARIRAIRSSITGISPCMIRLST
jgi:hypothetical protein